MIDKTLLLGLLQSLVE